jgi:hypothetical protein
VTCSETPRQGNSPLPHQPTVLTFVKPRREVADSSRGVAAALQAVAHYQRRSNAVLVHLLGRSYGARCCLNRLLKLSQSSRLLTLQPPDVYTIVTIGQELTQPALLSLQCWGEKAQPQGEARFWGIHAAKYPMAVWQQ